MDPKVKAALEKAYSIASGTTMDKALIDKMDKFRPLPYAEWPFQQQVGAHDIAQQIAWQIREFMLDLEVEDLTEPQKKVLAHIEKAKPRSSREITDAIYPQQPQMEHMISKIICKLESLKLIEEIDGLLHPCRVFKGEKS